MHLNLNKCPKPVIITDASFYYFITIGNITFLNSKHLYSKSAIETLQEDEKYVHS